MVERQDEATQTTPLLGIRWPRQNRRRIGLLPGKPLAEQLRQHLAGAFAAFPWPIVVQDWQNASYALGGQQEHWCSQPLEVTVKTAAAARDLLRLDGLGFLDRFVRGEVDLEGNLYALSDIQDHAKLQLNSLQKLRVLARHTTFPVDGLRLTGRRVTPPTSRGSHT